MSVREQHVVPGEGEALKVAVRERNKDVMIDGQQKAYLTPDDAITFAYRIIRVANLVKKRNP